MRGPLLSGPVGSPAALQRLCELLRDRRPVAVVSALWLAEALAGAMPITALTEPDKRAQARRAVARLKRRGRGLDVVIAGEDLPLGPGSLGAAIVESPTEIEEEEAAAELLVTLAATLRPDGLLIAVDATKDPAAEARVAGLFLAATLTEITQERPREGALLTVGAAPPAAVLAARMTEPALTE